MRQLADKTVDRGRHPSKRAATVAPVVTLDNPENGATTLRRAKTALERHPTAFSLWEASLKLLASVAIAEYAQRAETDPQRRPQISGGLQSG